MSSYLEFVSSSAYQPSSSSSSDSDEESKDLHPLIQRTLPSLSLDASQSLKEREVSHEQVMQNGQGCRILRDGTKERGYFWNNALCSGYQIRADQSVHFLSPKSQALAINSSETLMIIEFEGRLAVVEHGALIDMTVEDALLKICQQTGSGSVKKILEHPLFEQRRDAFVAKAFQVDDSGSLRIFNFAPETVIDVLEFMVEEPSTLIDPASGRHFFVHVAGNQSWVSHRRKILNTLIDYFPESFLSCGKDVIATLLATDAISCYQTDARWFIDKFKQSGGIIDEYLEMLFHVTEKIEPDAAFMEKVGALSPAERKALYAVAFAYNNLFFHEPLETPVTPDRYSINLMWINKEKMSDTEELAFQQRFVEPVVKWAKANPEGRINIWIDGMFATPSVIEGARREIEKALEGSAHGPIDFRDVRSTDVVKDHPEVFGEQMAVYFRADLLRAVVADDCLRNHETQFFVYADLDVEPLSGEELFDCRTMDDLTDYGIVLAKGGTIGDCENSFQILNGSHAQLMRSHREVIIDLSVQMAEEHPERMHEQQIYRTYPALITHILAADGRYGALNEAKLDAHGAKDAPIFRHDRFSRSAHLTLPLGEGGVALRDVMPRKVVSVPPSHF